MDRLWAMKVFARVAECESFSRAAESLDLANATVTTCVRNLEEHLGVTLLQRNSRHLHLTDEGTIYLQRARELLPLFEQADAEVAVRGGTISGNLRVELPFALGQKIFPHMPEFLRRHPALTVAINLTNQSQRLIERGTDLAVRMDSVDDAEMVARPICSARYVTCASPQLYAGRDAPKSPRELDPQRCLGLLSEGHYTPLDWVYARRDEHVVLRPSGSLLINSTDALIQTAIKGQWAICVLDLFVRAPLATGELVELFPEWSNSMRTFQLVTPKARFISPKIRVFADFLLEIFDTQLPPNTNAQIAVRSHRKEKKAARGTNAAGASPKRH